MKVSDYIVEFIKSHNVDTVFGYQGGAITHLVDSIYKSNDIKYVSLMNEQSAAFAAEGYSRISENIGVAIATSGPGATNLITGIGSCFFDSIPCVFITGQVNTYEQKRSASIRQEGFQEADIVKMVESITKYSISIKDVKDIRFHLEKAFFLAKHERGGPVLLDIPMDIQRSDINIEDLKSFYQDDEYKKLNNKKIDYTKLDEQITSLVSLIKNSERPIFLCGGGIRLSSSINLLKKITNITDIPVVTSLMGLDSISCEEKNRIGFMGVYGNRFSNLSVANSDLLIVLGSRLTTRQTGPNVSTFAKYAKIVHVDIDNNELNLKLKEDISINCDLNIFLDKFLLKLKKDNYQYDFSKWKEHINYYKEKYPSYPTQKNDKGIDPNEIINYISKLCKNKTIFTLDVGQNQIWAAQSLYIKDNDRVLTSGGMGAMGFSLPSAIGAYYANKNADIIAIVGDGGLQMNIQELQVIFRDNIPLKIILLNNECLGMIRHFQELYFNRNYFGTIDGYESPDFNSIFKAYKIDSIKIDNSRDTYKIEEILKQKKSYLIEILLGKNTYVIPKLEMGRPIEDQSPLLDRYELSQNMIAISQKYNDIEN